MDDGKGEEQEMSFKQQEEAVKKRKQEDMWATFKRDAGSVPSKSSKPSGSSDQKVSITRMYDFAGEAVV